jgi:PadR family transcriptional regulator, regulatory protein PadR
MGKDLLGTFEHWILMTLVRLRDNAYGRTIHQELEDRLGRAIALGQVYVTLERLETKGLVQSSLGGATATRGGRVKRYFAISDAGRAALNEASNAIDALRIPVGELS